MRAIRVASLISNARSQQWHSLDELFASRVGAEVGCKGKRAALAVLLVPRFGALGKLVAAAGHAHDLRTQREELLHHSKANAWVGWGWGKGGKREGVHVCVSKKTIDAFSTLAFLHINIDTVVRRRTFGSTRHERHLAVQAPAVVRHDGGRKKRIEST